LWSSADILPAKTEVGYGKLEIYAAFHTGVRFDMDFLKGAQASRLWAANCSVVPKGSS
jgi:hypothetical protein